MPTSYETKLSNSLLLIMYIIFGCKSPFDILGNIKPCDNFNQYQNLILQLVN